MHYLHLYHAGNFADVFKHVLLLALLEALSAKDTPSCFIDTHAGAGTYPLEAANVPDAAEWRQGIGRVWGAKPRSALLGRYLATLREVAGTGAAPHSYPGSPWWGVRMARPGDRVIACEQQIEIAERLRCAVPRAEIQRRDGYGLLGALPPRERRGLVLVDPPFERADEFDAARGFIVSAAKRYAGGVFALWYPLKNPHAAAHALRCLARDVKQPLIDFQLDAGRRGDGRMHACGMAVLRAPWRLADAVQPALEELAALLSPHAAASRRTVTFS